jgi:hypothetical protein
MAKDNGNGETAETPQQETFLQKLKGWFTRAKDSETAEKAGEFAGKAWDKTKDVSAKAWDKTKDVAEDVKEKVDEKMEERRTAKAEEAEADDDAD